MFRYRRHKQTHECNMWTPNKITLRRSITLYWTRAKLLHKVLVQQKAKAVAYIKTNKNILSEPFFKKIICWRIVLVEGVIHSWTHLLPTVVWIRGPFTRDNECRWHGSQNVVLTENIHFEKRNTTITMHLSAWTALLEEKIIILLFTAKYQKCFEVFTIYD